jgi:hypothetical protein
MSLAIGVSGADSLVVRAFGSISNIGGAIFTHWGISIR